MLACGLTHMCVCVLCSPQFAQRLSRWSHLASLSYPIFLNVLLLRWEVGFNRTGQFKRMLQPSPGVPICARPICNPPPVFTHFDTNPSHLFLLLLLLLLPPSSSFLSFLSFTQLRLASVGHQNYVNISRTDCAPPYHAFAITMSMVNFVQCRISNTSVPTGRRHYCRSWRLHVYPRIP